MGRVLAEGFLFVHSSSFLLLLLKGHVRTIGSLDLGLDSFVSHIVISRGLGVPIVL